MIKIIGLLGPAGSGKSTAAAHLADAHGARRYALADPLKEIAMRALGLAREQCYGTQAQKETVDPRYGFTPRWFLQQLGTEGIRHVFGVDVWVDALLRRVGHDAPAVAVVEDVRFLNEVRRLREVTSIGEHPVYHAAHVEVWRLEPPPGAPRASSDDGTHASEREWVAAAVDRVVAPSEFGVPQLHRALDVAWRAMNRSI